MTNWKAIVFGLIFVAMLPLASATQCWEEFQMPLGTWDYSVGLCRSYQVLGYWYQNPSNWGPFSGWLNGRIVTTAPAGHPQAGQTYRVILTNFVNSNPYPATYTCYKRMGVSGNYWWLYQATCTLNFYMNSGLGTCASWVSAQCPPTQNNGPSSPPTSPQGPYTGISWGGFALKSGEGTVANSQTFVKPNIRRR